MNFKNITAEKSTVTRDTVRIEEKTGNIYQSIAAISKRANQISSTLKEELTQKLQEFNTTTDNLEEIFENREQIEISRHYEKMAKPTAIATQELLEDKLFIRNPEAEK
ncbi:MAG: DNA-directed RNA polymerase subunit omega [Crocinitomicaceae bacterium]|jgi:DNA-directed RNA polymerase subunit K/omega|nr:DNA-directed RNA polymerase subunit omega [Crocinitomicaceae bacterium]MCF8410054.1 DNA-directed RNA polymerase subunit omega [Crocinitomicaceae bacterium]MCF8444281.1 DNA-directed RNA polymerase subunit omega [Crocinitomicaceae bacterium]